MFRQVISSTPMNSQIANSFFQNIVGGDYNGDFTFLSTLRALVAPRMQDGEEIRLYFNNSDFTASAVSSNDARRVVRAIYEVDYYSSGSIVIHSFNGRQEDNYACMELMKSTFCNTYSGWQRLEKVTEFFRKTFYCMCFVNPERRMVTLFVDSLNVRKMHYLQCAIFAFLPWYFNPEDGVKADEMELIQSLREKTPEKYEECIAKIASKYDFRTMHIRKALAGFETRYEKRECERTMDSIRSTVNKIEDLENRLSEYFRQKREYEIRLLGLETKIASSEGQDSEIMEYFLCNQKLVIDSVDDCTMTFATKDYMTYFDEDMARSVIDNDRSYVYLPDGRACNNYIEAADMKKLMYAIFIEQTLKLRFCSAYLFELGCRVRGIRGYNYGAEFRDYMPNPHIDRYSCIGNYERAINNCIKNNDYIGALEQSIASCKSLNFGDSTVMKVFMKRMYGIDGYSHNRCIETPDGKVLTPKEAVAWMKAEEERKAAEEAARMAEEAEAEVTHEEDSAQEVEQEVEADE